MKKEFVVPVTLRAIKRDGIETRTHTRINPKNAIHGNIFMLKPIENVKLDYSLFWEVVCVGHEPECVDHLEWWHEIVSI